MTTKAKAKPKKTPAVAEPIDPVEIELVEELFSAQFGWNSDYGKQQRRVEEAEERLASERQKLAPLAGPLRAIYAALQPKPGERPAATKKKRPARPKSPKAAAPVAKDEA